MGTRFLVLTLVFCGHAAGAQPSNALLQSFRAYTLEMGERLVLVARAMPQEHLQDHATAGEMSFGGMLLDVARQTERNCAIILGTKPPPQQALPPGAGKDVLVGRLQESFSLCNGGLARIDEGQLEQPAVGWDWEYVTGLQRTRAFVATRTMALWATRLRELELGLRQNHLVPPRVCIGGGDCDSGQNLCRTTGSPRISGRAMLVDAASSVKSDGRGPYLSASANATVEMGASAALIFTALHHANLDSIRSFTIDLSRPTPRGGGIPLGIVRVPQLVSDSHAWPAANDSTESRSTYASILAQWFTEPNETLHGVSEIPLGETIQAEQLDVSFTIDGVAHVLQMGPQPMWHCYSDKPAITGAGTTRATISHPSAGRWIIDLPAGSIGRLWDVHLLPSNAIDKGIFFVSLRLILDQ